MLRVRLSALVILFASSVTFAQETEEESPWSGAVSLGFLSTSGNTETTSYNAKFGIGYEKNKWQHSFNAQTTGADESETTTAESYQAGWKSEYSFTEHDFLFGTVDWRKDRFSGVDQQLTESIGYGRRLIDTPSHLLSAGLGVGHRRSPRSRARHGRDSASPS